MSAHLNTKLGPQLYFQFRWNNFKFGELKGQLDINGTAQTDKNLGHLVNLWKILSDV